MLKNIRVQAKLFVLLVIPLSALIISYTLNALDKYHERRALDAASDVVALSSAGGNFIHGLQKERGFSSGFIVSKGGAFVGELREQRQANKDLRKTLEEKMAAFTASNPDAPLNDAFDPLLSRLDKLDALRAGIDGLTVPVEAAIAEYSATIGQVQELIRGVPSYCENAVMYGQAMNYINLVGAKEFAGQERAMLNAALSSGAFSKALYRSWVERVAMQNEYLKSFLAHASPELRNTFSALVGSNREKVESFRRRVFDSLEQPRLEGEPKMWFEASTAYINSLHEVETAVTDSLGGLAHQLADSAGRQFYGTLGTALGVLLITALLVWRIVRDIAVPLRRSVGFAQSVADGKLDAELDMIRNDEFGTLASALNAMLAAIKTMIGKADAATESARLEAEKAHAATAEAKEAQNMAARATREGMAAAAERIGTVAEVLASASDNISTLLRQSEHGAREQSDRLASAATAMEEMNVTVLEVAKNSSNAAGIADHAREQAQKGAAGVTDVERHITRVLGDTEQLKEAMSRLGMRMQDIDKVLTVISDIADQTNLLALNAAIEAARAGEAGRGFAVVADEVRKLAEKTMTATKEVAAVLSGIRQETQQNITTVDKTVAGMMETTALTHEAGASLRKIVELSDETRDQISSIATASAEQSATSEEINRSVEDVNRIAVETVSGMEQCTRAVARLLEQTNALDRLIGELRG